MHRRVVLVVRQCVQFVAFLPHCLVVVVKKFFIVAKITKNYIGKSIKYHVPLRKKRNPQLPLQNLYWDFQHLRGREVNLLQRTRCMNG